MRSFWGVVLSSVLLLLLWPLFYAEFFDVRADTPPAAQSAPATPATPGQAQPGKRLLAADYYLHLCERGQKASSALQQEQGQTVVVGRCGSHNSAMTRLFRLDCPPPQQPGFAVPYTGSGYQVILKTCGDTLYGIDAAPTLHEYAEAYQLAFTWENLQTVRKFSVIAYLDHLEVKLLSTSGILKRIRGLALSSQTSVEILEREKELASTIRELYSLAFRMLEENTS